MLTSTGLIMLNPALWKAFVIAFGLVIGSFLNVVIARLPHGESVIHPRSRCPSCSKPIAWYDNFPVLSYLLLRGKCRSCSAQISVRYPVVELLCALLFLAVATKFPPSWLLVARDWPFVAMLLAITFIDIDHRIIPDELSLGGLVLGLLTAWWVPGFGLWNAVFGALLGYGVFFLMSWFYYRWKGKIGLGGGDVKLLAMMGAFLGPIGVFHVVLISSIVGSVIGISYGFILQRRGQADSLMAVAIPFGPFLVIGALYVYLLGDVLGLPVQL
jgi:leader peptidase (prepilin peptidase)/N-methyltransferase